MTFCNIFLTRYVLPQDDGPLRIAVNGCRKTKANSLLILYGDYSVSTPFCGGGGGCGAFPSCGGGGGGIFPFCGGGGIFHFCGGGGGGGYTWMLCGYGWVIPCLFLLCLNMTYFHENFKRHFGQVVESIRIVSRSDDQWKFCHRMYLYDV